MPNDSTRTVLVAIGADLGVALAKVGTAVFTGSSAVAAGAAEALADTANDVFLLIAQRRSSRPPDDQHPLGYGREAYFWALIAALGVFVAGAAFSLREGIDELIRPAPPHRSRLPTSCLASRRSLTWCHCASPGGR
jgi:divalent metal cation (Fe/Co/Zn/Cd) transporter